MYDGCFHNHRELFGGLSQPVEYNVVEFKLMDALANPVLVSFASVIQGKLRQFTILEERKVFRYSAFCRPIGFDTLFGQFFQGTATNTTHHNSINGFATKSDQRLALPVSMVEIMVVDSFLFTGFGIHDDEKASRAEMAVYLTFNPFILLRWKGNFHVLILLCKVDFRIN
jgi:hypothetical protein